MVCLPAFVEAEETASGRIFSPYSQTPSDQMVLPLSMKDYSTDIPVELSQKVIFPLRSNWGIPPKGWGNKKLTLERETLRVVTL